ncbi:hypothetical protein PsAD46_03820 [Pseudovibrio sp. Ad46]|uniref:hypothetical protein n=1 Tax=Pseudovibrio sp. Ad46 TaxID=989432 RepID=UPI0007AE5240|nr:hypothetical protein [Pseudovibrio sp. Ad46]KZK80779.1 hypothetical protein PsAD46_03820 [Pseudovibrio sp. Ad46]
MRLTKLRHPGVVLLITFAMLGAASSHVINRENIANPFSDMKRVLPSRQVIVDNLTVQTDAVGVEFCKERYGSGTTFYPDQNGKQGQFISDRNDKISLYDRSEWRQDGIYTEHSKLLITFHYDPDVEVEVTIFITGFIDSKPFSGVFSDGICTGHFSVVEAK